jgi:hypothetical protein
MKNQIKPQPRRIRHEFTHKLIAQQANQPQPDKVAKLFHYDNNGHIFGTHGNLLIRIAVRKCGEDDHLEDNDELGIFVAKAMNEYAALYAVETAFNDLLAWANLGETQNVKSMALREQCERAKANLAAVRKLS